MLLIIFAGGDNFKLVDELIAGTIAKMLIDGIGLGTIFHCLWNSHGGLIVGSIITVPFFLLFGQSLIVLRSVAIFFSSGTLILLYLFLYKFFNRRAAVLASLLFILAPPNYSKMSFTLVGGYADTNLFSILAFFIFYKIFWGGGESRRSAYALFGLVCGFSLFYDYGFLLTLSCCLLFWFVFDKGILARKSFYIFLAFFLVGFSPGFYYNATHNWNSIFVLRKEHSLLSLFTKNSLFDSLNQLKNLIVFDIPHYFGFNGFFSINKDVISYLYYSIPVVSFIGLFWLQRRSIARFLSGLIPLRRFNILPAAIQPETPLMIYLMIFGLAFAFCGIAQFAEDDSIGFPERLVAYIMPHIFIVVSIFLTKMIRHRHGAWISKMLVSVLIAIGLVGTLGMISAQDYAISALPEGYTYFISGRLFSNYNDDIRKPLDVIKTIDAKHRPLFYDGYKWGFSKIGKDFSFGGYAQKTIAGSIDKEYWPLAYEYLGRVMGRGPWRYTKGSDEEFKACVQEEFHPYFYRGLGRACVDKEFSVRRYIHILGIIDKRYWRSFHEGMGVEMDIMLIEHTKGFTRFISAIDPEARQDIYRGFAYGRGYPEISYRKFQPGFGKILPSNKEWGKRISTVEEEFRPYCYQRLGIEVGWRLIYGIRENLRFLQEVDEKYKPYVYRGLGIGIGWRFGHNINSCIVLIKKTEQRCWPWIYEGLGTGIAKRYGCRMDEQTRDKEADKIPPGFRRQFHNGLKEVPGI
ncbi:MAG: glycosyltransferase family 39 protein [Candidatus Omnitrophica bacterium]|nr:glycosyltransferase family 39 protein [Candidatus Omnitrophota bacterium]